MQIVEITDSKIWDSFKNDWQRLQKICKPCHPFLDWNWVRPWVGYLPLEQKKPLILIVKNEHNDVVGIVPLQINQKGFCTYLEGFAQEFSDYIDWLCLPGWEQEMGRNISEWLISKKKEYDCIRIFNILPGGAADKILNTLFPSYIQAHSIAPHVEMNGTYDDFIKTLKSKFVSDTRRRKRKLIREIGDMEYFIVKDSHQISELLKYVKKWLDARRTEQNETSYLDRQGMQEHLNCFYKKLFSLGMLHFSGLKVNNCVVALNIAFKYNNSLFSYTPVSDPALKKYSLIRLLKFQHLEDSYESDLYLYDFCLGGEEYKYKFLPVIKQLYCFTLYGKTTKGWLLRNYHIKFKPLLESSAFFKKMKHAYRCYETK